MEDTVSRFNRVLQEAYEYIKAGLWEKAFKLLNRSLIKVNSPEQEIQIKASLNCIQYVQNVESEISPGKTEEAQGDEYLKGIKSFVKMTEGMGGVSEQLVFNIKHYLFSRALRSYKDSRTSGSYEPPELFFKMGRCYKGIGNFADAREILEHVVKKRPEYSPFLAELADCYALLGDIDLAKVFFREAFFYDPKAIELEFLESGMILKLIEEVKARGYAPPLLQEWLPVYGVVLGVFNIKRELRSVEVGKLKQSIFSMEEELKNMMANRDVIVPRLINRYFWLIDHYRLKNEEPIKIKDAAYKIKLLDSEIYKLYTR
ncbi:tetratricopeptide repeat protein [Spirochaetia bacterium 38H-sp]|uniref:Tetratricopeptide repeat protein n=1 Tax=Rarispira pelagica TaxID=3141764 RepID=A0ABU9UAN0_9SPIR